ncbi:hypothetical protein [[Clostridium] fimetarium]|uniref:Uncharacterized protein n=1 Tax=[Clostridium] fimetarium TaxID=99656 RepID=A0A1I0R634_9FIRM|nr:hypothetical protein [[Clostridium] fimetarium]SEW36025.1 hypothetical protein SAMN05421659_11246 [[Clostridium] fimetarium]
MKKLPIVEVVMGAVLIISIIGFYALKKDNTDNNAQKSTTVSAENNSESE